MMRRMHATAAVTAAVSLVAAGVAVAKSAPAESKQTSGKMNKPMSPNARAKRNTEIVRDYIERVFNQHHPEQVAQLVAPDVVWHGGTLGTVSGADNLTYLLTSFIGALPDIHAAEQDVVASGDLVAIRLVVTATQKGDLLGIPATNRVVQWDAVDIYRINKAGKITEEWAAEEDHRGVGRRRPRRGRQPARRYHAALGRLANDNRGPCGRELVDQLHHPWPRRKTHHRAGGDHGRRVAPRAAGDRLRSSGRPAEIETGPGSCLRDM